MGIISNIPFNLFRKFSEGPDIIQFSILREGCENSDNGGVFL